MPMTDEEREQIVALLRAGANLADEGSIFALRGACLLANVHIMSDVAKQARAALESVAPNKAPTTEQLAYNLRWAASRVESKEWP